MQATQPGRREPAAAAGRRRRLLIFVFVFVFLLVLVALDDGVVEGEERGKVGGGERAAGRPAARPGGQHAAALVEGVLRLGDLLGGSLRRRLRQARERLGLARVEVRQPPPAITIKLLI